LGEEFTLFALRFNVEKWIIQEQTRKYDKIFIAVDTIDRFVINPAWELGDRTLFEYNLLRPSQRHMRS
jgi:hypothetical protein